MAVGDLLLDTNAYAAYKKGDAKVLELLKQADSIVLNSIVLGELFAGFVMGNRESQNLAELNRFLGISKVRELGLDSITSKYFAKVFADLRSQGTPIPTNDIWIAATAFQHQLKVLSFDKHFQSVKGLELINPSLASS